MSRPGKTRWAAFALDGGINPFQLSSSDQLWRDTMTGAQLMRDLPVGRWT